MYNLGLVDDSIHSVKSYSRRLCNGLSVRQPKNLQSPVQTSSEASIFSIEESETDKTLFDLDFGMDENH